MIDVENVVINDMTTTLRSEYLGTYPKLKIYGEYVDYPESFPCVSLWCEDNYTDPGTREIDNTDEHYVRCAFRTEVIAVGDDRKAVAKDLADRADEVYRNKGFSRLAMLMYPDTQLNAFRITMRHSGLVQRPSVSTDGEDESLTSLIYR